jgi:hypothetical protein
MKGVLAQDAGFDQPAECLPPPPADRRIENPATGIQRSLL